MKRMAREELEGQAQELDQLRDHLIDQLLPRDEADDSGCILEVRAGGALAFTRLESPV